MNDYIPLMDKYPELQLVPTARVTIDIPKFQNKFDYVQNLDRVVQNKKEKFHLVVKDNKFGVLFYAFGIFFDKKDIALPAKYEHIEYLYKINRSFGAIVQRDGKFGLYYWAYGLLRNENYSVLAEYDSMELLENKRIKGIKNDTVTYFDFTGQVLK